jgi:hypothetical protein
LRHSGEDQAANLVIAALAVLFLSEAVAWESRCDLLALGAVIAPLNLYIRASDRGAQGTRSENPSGVPDIDGYIDGYAVD